MPRYARPHVTGGLFHVISRFHNREYLMDVDGARDRYLQCLATGLSRTDARLLAYCLMSSHVHLVLQLGTRPLGSFTRSVNVGWANWLNKKKGRIGTVMADRSRSVLCDSDTYALELVRYVHNNPVRASIVSKAEESSWSSHRAYLGLVEPPEWLEIEPVLCRLAGDVERARGAFAKHVDEHRVEPRRAPYEVAMRNLGTKFAWIQWSVGKRSVESMKERRRAARVEIKVPVRTAVRVQRTGRISEGRWNLSRDLSELGMYILYDTSIPVGTDVELTFDLPGVARNVPARGIVRRVDLAEGPGGRGGGMALEFTDVLPLSSLPPRKR